MSIHVRDSHLNILDMHTRMPFRYGIATLTALPHVFVTLDVSIGGRPVTGTAADGLPPKWFEKDPEKSFASEIDDMLNVIRHACDVAVAAGSAPTVFALWETVYQAQRRWALENTSHPALLWGFGVTLVERALIDAFCRAAGVPFAEAVRENLLGLEPASFYDELANTTPADLLPKTPTREIAVRHTVGLADPLTESDIDETERLDDGLPQALDAAIRTYGLTHFKIKLQGDCQADLTRLQRLAKLIGAVAPADIRFTLDANEQFVSVEHFQAFWKSAQADSDVRRFFEHLLFVEQPFQRSIALSEPIGAALLAWRHRPPIIIDESDAELTTLKTALDHGYAGSSHKNCKGVFKGIANRCLIERRRQTNPATHYLLSAEDLANVGPVALMQDLAVVATLGLTHAERNGHHYFRGLSMLPDDLQADVLARHPDLYQAHPDGYPTLRVAAGKIALETVVNAPFGVASTVNGQRFQDAAMWRATSLHDT